MYLNRMGTSTMASPHIPVTLGNCTRYTQITIFPVHVMRSRSRIITQPDTKVLNLNRCLLWDQSYWYDLSSRFLEFFQLSQEIPKSWFGHYFVRREYPHFIQGSILFFFGGQFAPNDFIFLQLQQKYNLINWIGVNTCTNNLCVSYLRLKLNLKGVIAMN